eukprot:2328626-Rhodomonas_salina.4
MAENTTLCFSPSASHLSSLIPNMNPPMMHVMTVASQFALRILCMRMAVAYVKENCNLAIRLDLDSLSGALLINEMIAIDTKVYEISCNADFSSGKYFDTSAETMPTRTMLKISTKLNKMPATTD